MERMFREHAQIYAVALAGGARLADLDVVGDGGGRWVAEGIAALLFLYLGEP
jgi:hypothetical protein